MKLEHGRQFVTQQAKPVRNPATTYQNQTGKPMFIHIRLFKAGSAAWALTDSSSPPTTRVAGGLTAQNDASTIIVLPNNYYLFDVDAIDSDAYTEWY